MVALVLNKFAGMMPRLSKRLLPEGISQIARNAKLTSGELRPFRNALDIMATDIPAPITLYKFNEDAHQETQFWFQWDHEVNVVRGLVSGDTNERTYWTDGVQPKMTVASIATGSTPYPSNSYNLGLPAPESISASASGTATDELNPEARAYICTYVSAYGEEGPASLPSDIVTVNTGQGVAISNIPAAPTGAYNVQSIRIYRALSGSSATGYQFLVELPIGTATYSDTKLGTELAEICPSMKWVAPPAGLRGLAAMACGSLVGFAGKDVYFSEPNEMHAWPVEYMLSVEHTIVGLGVFGNTVVVCTEGYPVVISGSDPSSMTPATVAENYSCLSERSIVSLDTGVLFASASGLVLIGAGGTILVTEKHFSRDDWQALNPASIHAALYDNRYYAFYDNGTTQGGLIFYPAENDLSYIDLYASAAYVDKQLNALYLAVAGRLVKWDYGTDNLTYTWRSKQYVMPAPINFGAAQVDADSYPVTLNVYADGVQRFSTEVRNGFSFRLPAGFLAKNWEFELIGSGNVEQLQIAESISGLGAV